MDNKTKYRIILGTEPGRERLQKGMWIAIINAQRVPPHAGMIFNGLYSSLNVKGKEIDVEVATLLRGVDIQKKKCVFVKLRNHPVFSVDFLREHFLHELQQLDRVSESTTCFAPVRSFMKENYLLKQEELKYLYELFPLLESENMMESAFGINLNDINEFYFEPYTSVEIANELKEARKVNLIND